MCTCVLGYCLCLYTLPPSVVLHVLPQEVGWRNDSQRIVMVLTDAGFKTALDGKVEVILLFMVYRLLLTLARAHARRGLL